MIFTQETYKSITRYTSEWVPPEINSLARTLGFGRAKQMIGKDIPIDVIQQMQKIKAEYAKRKIQRSLKRKAKREATLQLSFIQFCKLYLRPFFGKMCVDEVDKMLSFDIDWDIVKKRVCSMPYKDFLDCYYWKALRFHLLNNANNCCTECRSHENLQVHHLSYSHHGDELHYLNDLVVLCGVCHNKKHHERCSG